MNTNELTKKKKEAGMKINAIVKDLLSDIDICDCVASIDITRRLEPYDTTSINVNTEIKIVL